MEEQLNHKELMLVSGDFSGIQDTVYTISSKGALKSLRARSFMLELLTEHIVCEILKLAGKTPVKNKPKDYLIRAGKVRTGVIYSGGGAFSLLLENKNGLNTKIRNFSNKLNKWAYDEFSGKLFIAIHLLEASTHEINTDFQRKRQKQADELDKLKRRKFWRKDNCTLLETLLRPTMPVQTDIEKECQITRRDDLSVMKKLDDMSVSPLSFHLWHLGDHLTELMDGKQIYRYDSEKITPEKGTKGHICFPTPYDTYMIYSIKPIDNNHKKGDWRKIGTDFFYAYYVRKVKDLPQYAKDAELKVTQETKPDITSDEIKYQTASFAGLAACSCGADMIAALRMDVDNLGKLFSEIKSPTELAQRSHQLNYFFKVILNRICEGNFREIRSSSEKNAAALFNADALKSGKLPTRIDKNIEDETEKAKKRNISIIYAGGDDLFIVGAWNEVAELAFDIRKCFAQYCEKNDIRNKDGEPASISGGLTLHHPKFPLYQMAARSKAAEHEAKTCKEKNDTEPQKNRIALFHDPVKVQRRNQLKQKGNEREIRYMLSMSWEKGNRFLLPLMREFVKLGGFISGEENKRSLFVMDKISHQSIEKCFMITEKFQQSGERYMPTMARIMADVCRGLKRFGQEKLFLKLMVYLYRRNNPNMPHLHIALNWISFLRRTR
ncbi:type III-A CRISPR-associated protein Cas10/Csm1 [Desulfobacterales bacterium HSG2]|nr:type III-A CRISPR-associated protein Cas10/Csm1 [Desulfobacterales bacterium HSG2]